MHCNRNPVTSRWRWIKRKIKLYKRLKQGYYWKCDKNKMIKGNEMKKTCVLLNCDKKGYIEGECKIGGEVVATLCDGDQFEDTVVAILECGTYEPDIWESNRQHEMSGIIWDYGMGIDEDFDPHWTDIKVFYGFSTVMPKLVKLEDYHPTYQERVKKACFEAWRAAQ